MLSPLCEDSAVAEAPRTAKRRYAVVGTGERAAMFLDAIAGDYAPECELAGLCDASLVRARYHQERLLREFGCGPAPVWRADEFEAMVRESGADTIIVCTVDATHHQYIIRALELGCDVITEKPMTTDAEKCRAIFSAVQRTGRTVRVAFNCRWSPGTAKVRELIAAGAIGSVKAINLEYQLNTSHGADYFRRWHSNRQSSGGLLVHKSTHHFDLVNWWADSIPQEVFAYGGLHFYGRQSALRRGDAAYTQYDRYHNAEGAKNDPFALALEDEARRLYLEAEAESGYIRDRNVFRDDIDIEDTMSVLVRYRDGLQLNYSLVAYCPQEGYRVSFTGDKGRIEYSEVHGAHILDELGRPVDNGACGEQMHLRLIPHFQAGRDIEIPVLTGGHGGSDPLLQQHLFSAAAPCDQLGRTAGHQQGAASILIGIAANQSMQTGLPVRIDDLCPLPDAARRLSDLV